MEETDRQDSFSAEGSWSPPHGRGSRATSKPRTASLAAAAKIKAKARSRPGLSKSEEKTALVRQRALDKEFAKAGVLPQASSSVSAVSEQQLVSPSPIMSGQQTQGVESQSGPPLQGADRPGSPGAMGDAQAPSGISGVGPRVPEATFTPTVVGLHQGELGEQEVPDFMKRWIDQAIRKDIAEGMSLQCQAPVPMYDYRPSLESHRFIPEVVDYQEPVSPTPSELSRYAEDFQGEEDFSDAEQEPHQRPHFRGLFNPALLRPLLAKARATAGLGQAPAPSDKDLPSGDQEDFLFSEQPVATDTIPVPDMFIDTIRKHTEGILPKALAQQISSQDMQSASVCGKKAKTLENVYNQEIVAAECFVKPENIASGSSAIPLEMTDSHSAMLVETSKQKYHPEYNRKNECSYGLEKASSQDVDPEIHHASTSFNVSFGKLPSPKVARRSMSRFSLKQGVNRRKSLPPFHVDILDLSKAISLDLPEAERMAALLLSSFQYSAQKLEQSLGHMEGFNFETFQQNVSSLSEELRLHIKKLILDGMVQKCFDDPKCGLSDPAFNELVAALKDTIARFSAENQAWDELLLSYQKKMEEISRQLESCELKQASEESCSYLGASQAHVLQAKPDYQKILDCQAEVFYCLEGVLDEISQMVKVCQTYVEDTTLYLQKLSAQLASRTFLRLEKSPARKLLRLFQTKSSVLPPPKD